MRRALGVCLGVAFAAGCGNAGSLSEFGAGGAGASAATGGANFGSGGDGASGGNNANTGGVVGSGGGDNGGGPSAGGGDSGGTTATGGTQSAGGVPSSDGGLLDASSTAGGAPARIDAGPVHLDAGNPVKPDAGAPPPPITGVLCNERHCDVGATCCYSSGSTLPPSPSTYTCAASSCPVTAAARKDCDSAADCHEGKSCCKTTSFGGAVRFSCQTSCTSTEVGCGGPNDCPAKALCCETTAGIGLAQYAVRTTCASSCTAAQYRLCEADTDCPASTPSCVDSALLPGFRRCQ